jgi:uncharacterized protein YbbK (DUF523 family)
VKKILVSECLYGGRTVRYDGGDVPLLDPVFIKWKEEGRLTPICPEVYGGLPTPRPDAQRKGHGVFTRTGADVTEAFRKGAEEALRLAVTEDVCFCVMKADSPSCGSKMIYDGSFTGDKCQGQGLTVEFLRNASFIVFDETDIAEAKALLESLDG